MVALRARTVARLFWPLTFLLASPLAAQDSGGGSGGGDIELSRAQIQAERQAIVNRAMELTDSESTKFWPLYREYRTKMAEVTDRQIAVIKEYAATYDSMTDDQADKLMSNYLDFQKDKLNLEKDYTKKFKKKAMQKKRFCTLIIDKLEWRPGWMDKKKAADLLYIDFRNPLTHDLGKDPRPGFEGLKEPTLGIWGNVKPKRVAAVDARKKWRDDWATLEIITDAQGKRYKLTVIALYWGVKKIVKDLVADLSV